VAGAQFIFTGTDIYAKQPFDKLRVPLWLSLPRARARKDLLTFFLSDEKESKQRKNRRHRFIGQFLLYTDSVNLNTLFLPSFSAIWLFHHHILCWFKSPAGIHSSVVNLCLYV